MSCDRFVYSRSRCVEQAPLKSGGRRKRLKAPKIRRIPTALGTLEFCDGAPTKGTARKAYDNLDLIHAVDAFVRSFSSVSQYRLRKAQHSRANQPGIFLKVSQKPGMLRMSRYAAFSFIDLERDGPTVLHLRAGVLGIVKDMWFRFVGELGVAEASSTSDPSYLLLPPSHQGTVPDGCRVIRPRTNQVCVLIRPARARASPDVPLMQGLRVHSLSSENTECVEIEDRALSTIEEIAPDDSRFYHDLHSLVQEQPAASLDAERRNLFASIGIIRGKPFRPSIRLKTILREAVAIGSATMRAMKAQHFAPYVATIGKVPPQLVAPARSHLLTPIAARSERCEPIA